MDKQSLKEVQDFFSQPLHEELLEAAGISQDEIDDLVAQSVKIDGKEIDADDVEDARTGEKDVNEALGTATIIALPVLLKLAGKAANKIKQNNLKGADKTEFKKLLKQALDAKNEMKVLKKSLQSFDKLSRSKPGPTTSPEQVKKYERFKEIAKDFNVKKREYEDTNKEIDSKFSAFKSKGFKVGYGKDKELTIIQPGNALVKLGKLVHNVYAAPITAVLYGMSLFAGKGSKLKDKNFRKKVANIVYAGIMTFVAGKGIVDSLSNLSGIADIATAAIEGVEENASLAEIVNAYLESAGVMGELENA